MIKLIKENKCLWDVCTPEYWSTTEKREALKKISGNLGTSLYDLRNKINALRSHYKRIRRSAKEFKKKGKFYETKWKYYNATRFMFRIYDEDIDNEDSIDVVID